MDRRPDDMVRITTPEQVIEVFAEEARKLDGIEFFAQGTIWPDILESENGIKDEKRAFEWCWMVRAVNTTDVMTATVAIIYNIIIDKQSEKMNHGIGSPSARV